MKNQRKACGLSTNIRRASIRCVPASFLLTKIAMNIMEGCSFHNLDEEHSLDCDTIRNKKSPSVNNLIP